MRSCCVTTLSCSLLLVVGMLLPGTRAQAVVAGQKIAKRALYPDAQGGLSSYTNLTAVMPGHPFTLSQASQGDDKNCYYAGGTNECAKVNSAWTVYTATYSDNSKNGVYICICGGAPFSAQSLASSYSQVRT